MIEHIDLSGRSGAEIAAELAQCLTKGQVVQLAQELRRHKGGRYYIEVAPLSEPQANGETHSFRVLPIN